MYRIFLVSLLLVSLSATAQKPLSKAAIVSFARACEFNFQYNANGNFFLITLVNRIRVNEACTLDQVNLYMISTESDKEARHKVFKAFYHLCAGDRDKLTVQLFNFGINAALSKELASYIALTFSKVASTASEEKTKG